MALKTLGNKPALALDINSVTSMIAKTQLESGEIPWSDGDKTDPWDLVEAIMGLSIGGYYKEALKAFKWMADNQNSNGSWYASYNNGKPEDKTLDTNMSSYIAVGVYHYYLITGDINFLKRMWPIVKSGINFALSLQSNNGEIFWAKSPEGEIDHMSLLTGSCSIFMSLKCSLSISKLLDHNMPEWEKSIRKLGNAIRNRRHAFNVTKSRYSMYWFYPILSGALTGREAQNRIDKYWKKFIVEGLGVRCVSDEPWVTIAETSELVLALSAVGNNRLAEIVFGWIHDKRFEDGTYWGGF
ncbi:MAG: phenyltransferase domain-containing protein, partial [Desulfobacteraceae bacterium]|nr:phenyltransferase domain-containing protein [Desulfobacteraceae bacterium]